ncbi:hypothetical protein DSM106972_098080 [Dulcicalothrix desertica PCC 7102]|uniref:DUF3854 domain-containing protein n=1 Tax=Dulcicalothrix desertica PCC 7102 TaxID=232991 RepID=A0A433UG72_9CYAN|nr:plasmid replication protein, CyRepA1 family [Dulcicalothrix desertica]RUS92789.1 hypothetical protein DSM106972_098080 [Dulcicalothrix desertica PCC 7102]TWH61457.1 uncharacterized protein DUF3854 [Dulcicalothrix desertica PCC 7102]
MKDNALNLYPNDLTEAEYHELAVLSAIHPALIEANFIHIEGALVYTYLFISEQIKRRNTGRVTDGFLKQYQHAEHGGMWISGLDPVNDWRPMEWGRFKPEIPRIDWQKGKPVKYESPPKTPNRVTYFDVPDCIWDLVAQRYKIKRYNSSLARRLQDKLRPLTFWEWVILHPEIPIILCEGEKKAACLMSLGFVAIPLPGIWGGRVGKRDFSERLHPDLMHIAQKGRQFIILFDYETKLSTRWTVHQATVRTGEAIEAVGCACEVASLPGPDKGVDDFVFSRGPKANEELTAIINDAKTLAHYKRSYFNGIHRGLTNKYPADIRVTVKYLTEVVNLPDAGLVVIASDMGTAKTELVARWHQRNPEARFLNNGHRVNLLKNLSERLKTQMYNELKHGDLAKAKALSITIDSLHKLHTDALKYDCVFIDEACQYLTHLLHSKTCRENRAQILEVLEYIVYNARLVIIADAHMDDITVNFFRAMRPKREKPLIIVNEWKNGGRPVFWYEGNDSSALVAQISAALITGDKVMVVSDSKRFIKKLEKSLSMPLFVKDNSDSNSQLPPKIDDEKTSSINQSLRIWAIHSENSGSEENVAFIKDITNAVTSLDALLTSPSLGTGVDIPNYHFDAVFGVFHGVSQTATECVQQLYRYRPKVPIDVWVAPRPPFGYKDTNATKIKERLLQTNQMTAFLLKIDRETGKRGAEKDWALDAYCQIQAKRHQSINNLRADLRNLLTEMGNTIMPMGAEDDALAKERLKEAAKALDAAYCDAVAKAKDIPPTQYRQRQSKDYLKPEEVFECEKFRIKDAYGMEVTEELVAKDKGGKLHRDIAALEAVISEPEGTITDPRTGKTFPLPPAIVTEKDRQERLHLPLCMDWGNYSPRWLARFTLGLPKILKRLIDGEEITAADPDLVRMTKFAIYCAPHVKAILGFTVPPDCEPIWLLGTLLEQLGLKLVDHKVGARGKQVKHVSLSKEEFDFALKVIKHRENKRAQKEERARQAAEDQRRYQAGMLVMYGVEPPNTHVSTPPHNGIGEPPLGGVDTTEKGGVNFVPNG